MKTIFLLLCGLLVGCATQSRVAPKPPVTLTNEEGDIYEAVFRHQFPHNASATQQSAGSYFIQIQGADPSDAFLQRFSGQTPLVKRASEARHARDSALAQETFGVMRHGAPSLMTLYEPAAQVLKLRVFSPGGATANSQGRKPLEASTPFPRAPAGAKV